MCFRKEGDGEMIIKAINKTECRFLIKTKQIGNQNEKTKEITSSNT